MVGGVTSCGKTSSNILAIRGIELYERLGNALVSDAGHLDILFGEDAAKGGVRGIVTGTITDKKHIGYPGVDYSSLSGTICSVNKSIDNALLVDFISLACFISLHLLYSRTRQFAS